MPYTVQNNSVYRDLEMDSESSFESAEILAETAQARNARRRKVAFGAVIAVAALVCLLPATHARGTSPRAPPLASTVTLNEESGINLQSIKGQAEASVAKTNEALKSQVSELKETAKSFEPDLKRTLEDSKFELAKKAEETAKSSEPDLKRTLEDSKSEVAKKAEETVKSTKKEVEQEVKASAAKLAEEKVKEKLGDDGVETVAKAKAYVDKSAEEAHTHSGDNVDAANAYAATNTKQASDYAEAVFNHATGAYDSPCIENNVAYHPVDMKGQHISYEKDINGCLSRCKNTTGCAHFTFFRADGSCHVTDEHAKAAMKSAGAFAGTPECEPVVEKKMNATEHAAKSAELANAYAKQSAEAATAYNEGNVKRTQTYTEESQKKALAFAAANVPELKALAEKVAPQVPASEAPANGVPTAKEEAEEETSSCIEDQVAYHPLDMPGTAVSSEEDISACLSRCKETEGCERFTYFKAHRACHLQDAGASKAEHSLGAQAGKPDCEAMVFKKL